MGTFYVFMGGEVGVNRTEFGETGWGGGGGQGRRCRLVLPNPDGMMGRCREFYTLTCIYKYIFFGGGRGRIRILVFFGEVEFWKAFWEP